MAESESLHRIALQDRIVHHKLESGFVEIVDPAAGQKRGTDNTD